MNDFIEMLDHYTIVNENEIWIFDDSKRYPCLSLLLANDNVAVHYFRNDSDAGSISVNKNILESNECVFSMIYVWIKNILLIGKKGSDF